MSLVANERAKLTATYLNGVAIALAAIGGVSPWVSSLQGVNRPSATLALGSGICFVLSAILHLAGRMMLGRLRE